MIYFFKTSDKINLLLLYWARQDCIRGKNGPLLFEGLRVKQAPLQQQVLVASIYMYISCINELLTSSLSKQTNARKKSPYYKEKDFVQGWFALLSLLAAGVALGSNIA